VTVELSFLELVVRLSVASLCGGLIGIDRGRKNRAAGFRTYMLVCMGAALTVVLGIYIVSMLQSGLWGMEMVFVQSDVSRFGAQVINGIGFIGTGTILVTVRQQVKGMTTAAGLWASACMGLAIGAGFYSLALIGSAIILLTIIVFSKLEQFILAHTRNVNLYIEFENTDNISKIIETLKTHNVRIYDVELSNASEKSYPTAVFSLCLPKKKSHVVVIAAIAENDCVRVIEEI
jgi:putative Mg2+ transporter-C (MgtC) family protein